MRSENDRDADRLIAELLGDPEKFTRDASANELLKKFFRGYSIDNLLPLLRNENISVVKNAIWIASELPALAPACLEEAAILSKHADMSVRYLALEVVALGTIETRREKFILVAKGLEDPENAVVGRAASLLARASDAQLAAAKNQFEKMQPASRHIGGLEAVLGAGSGGPGPIEAMIRSTDPLERRYGLAAAHRAYGLHPHLIELASQSSDAAVAKAAASTLRIESAAARRALEAAVSKAIRIERAGKN